MKTIFNLSLLCAFGLFFLSGCVKSEDPKTPEQLLQENLALVNKAQLDADLAVIDDSLQKWSIIPEIEPNGVRYSIITTGNGPTPTLRSNIAFTYKGRLLKNKSVFDQGTTARGLKELIIGWQTTMPLISEGSKVILYIPSGLAYGAGAQYDTDGNILIPPNSNVIFEVEVLDVF